MLAFDLERVRLNVRQAETEDLLDRITVYRADMEEEAIIVIEAELLQRGIGAEQIEAHQQMRREQALWMPDGTIRACHYCYRPAVRRAWGWHHLWGIVPVFPRRFFYCAKHLPS